MSRFLRRLSLVPKGLRYKLLIAFSLMSVIPLMICVYLAVNFIFPYTKDITSVSAVVFLSMVIAILGLILAKNIVDPVINMALEARIIASGDLERRIKVEREDEIGAIGTSLNILTQRIKENIGELKSFGEKTKEINVEIHKKVLALSSLLQIGNLISQGAELENILDLIVEKVSQFDGSNPTFLMLNDPRIEQLSIKASIYIPAEAKNIKLKMGEGLLGRVARSAEVLVLDSTAKLVKDADDFKSTFGIKNALILPIISHGQPQGVLVCGNNNEDYAYKSDEIELMKIFVKQVIIAIENDFLLKKTEQLAIKDELTGLYNENYIRQRLDEEIKRAILYRRPCSFILFDIDDFKKYHATYGELGTESALKKIGGLFESSVGAVDRVARFGDNTFALVLPEKNKREAVSMAEDVRKRVEELILPGSEAVPRKLTVSGGVSENPIDGVTAGELIEKALNTLKIAKSSGKNKISY